MPASRRSSRRGCRPSACACPPIPRCRRCSRAVGRPLAAPSANRSGSISPTRAEHVLKSLGGRIPLDHRRRRDRARAWNRPSSRRPAGRCGCFGRARSRSMPKRRPARRDRSARASSRAIMRRRSRCGSNADDADAGRISDRLRRGRRAMPPSARSGDLVEAAARLFDLLHQADASAKPRIAVAPVPDEGTRRRDQRPPAPRRGRLGGRAGAFGRAWKLFLQLLQLGRDDREAIGVALPFAGPIVLVIILGRIPFARWARSS